MIYALGPRSRRVYNALRERIASGEFAPGTIVPSPRELAVEFGVAPMTVRQVLARLEQEGLVERRHGRGTIVRAPAVPAVLIVDDDPITRTLLRSYITNVGYRAVEAGDPDAALAILEQDQSIALILSDVRMPDKVDGIGFMLKAQRRWSHIPLAAVTSYPEDLADLHGTPECPVLILPKPVWPHQIEEVLRLALQPAPGRPDS